MADRDPFPMTSKQAVALAASVEGGRRPTDDDVDNDAAAAAATGGGGGGSAWNRMKMPSSPTTTKGVRFGGGRGSSGDVSNKNKPLTTGGGHRDSTASVSMDMDTKLHGVSSREEDDDDDDDDDDSSGYDNDDYFDRPIHDLYSRRRPFSIFTFGKDHFCGKKCNKFFHRLFRKLYGNDVPPEEIRRVLVLSMTLFFMIGGYWLLRSLKDTVLTALCGITVIPRAKMVSVFVVLGVVSIYNQLLGREDIPKHCLFYFFGMFYFILFASIAYLLTDPIIGLPNEVPNPNRLLGWISYCAIESFGSVMVSLFWSFANSVTSLESAKASYGLMVATAQIGSILGPTIVQTSAGTIGVAGCYFLGAICMLLLQGTMVLYIHLYGAEDDDKAAKAAAKLPKKKKKNAGVTEGLVLFFQHNYIKGIFAISCLFMVEVTIVDYTMKVLANQHFAELHPCTPDSSCWGLDGSSPGLSSEATEAFATFMGLFGQATNTLSFLMSLLGTSAVIRTLGLRLTLLLFPTMCLVIIIAVRFSPTLWMVFAAMMMLKASSYALNNPTKELLYQPTSSAVKYKAKSWIDIFGARGSKALGSVVTDAYSHSAELLVRNGSLVGMAVATFLIFNARYMGRKFDEYVKSGYIVGGEDEEWEDAEDLLVDLDGDDGNYDDDENGDDVAGGDTSCALYDDTNVGVLEEGQADEDDEEDDDEEEEEEDADLDDLIGDEGKKKKKKKGGSRKKGDNPKVVQV